MLRGQYPKLRLTLIISQNWGLPTIENIAKNWKK